MSDHEEIYGDERSERLKVLLREFADLVLLLHRDDRLLSDVPALLRRLGDIRSELFHYEVRCTYDSPEVAHHRRIVEEAVGDAEGLFEDDSEDDQPWRKTKPE